MTKKTEDTVMTVEEAARRLGAKPREIYSVAAHSHGTVVVTTDGTKTLICDVPDGEGKTGVMLLERPDGLPRDAEDAPVVSGPIFAPAGEDELDEIAHIDEPLVDGDGEHVVEPVAVEKKSK